MIAELKQILENDNITLTGDQEKAMEMCIEQDRALVLGSAGTGKSELIRILSIYFEIKGKKVCRIAPTGVAALKIDGYTIHKKFMVSGEIDQFNKLDYETKMMLKKSLKEIDVFIIDEISMLTPIVAEYMFEVIKMLKREEHKNFKILCFGDLFQLPPVIDEIELEAFLSTKKIHLKIDQNFQFLKYAVFHQAFRWENFKAVILKEIVRQSDKEFIDMLETVKLGKYHEKYNRQINFISQEEIMNCILNENAIFACGTNETKDIMNNKIVNKLPGEPIEFDSLVEYCEPEFQEIAEQKIVLKENMRVMLLVNQYNKETKSFHANGQIGIIKKINGKESVEVEFNNGSKEKIEPKEFEIKEIKNENGKYCEIVMARFERIPLVPAYAMTIHKLQGTTIDKMILYPLDIFDYGHLYVALSRVRSLDDLFLTNWIGGRRAKTDPNIKNLYEYIEEHNEFPDYKFFDDIMKNALIRQLKISIKNYEKREMFDEIEIIKEKIQKIEQTQFIWDSLSGE